jgi:predicted nucleic acid-binding protein
MRSADAVFDTSAVLRSLFKGPNFENADTLLRAFRPVLPNFVRYEASNVLRTMVRADRLGKDEARSLFQLILSTFEFVDDADLLPKALALGLTYRHGTYDMLFVACAEKFGIPLVTADKRLAVLADEILSTDVYDVNLSDQPL